jgi:translation initiation factor 5A
MSKPTELGSLKIGSYILLPVSDQPTGDACRITEFDTSKPGKHGSAKARIVGVGIFDGQKRPHVGPVSMQVHVPLIDKRTGQIISMVGSNIQVMDSETFETIDIDMIDEEVEGKIEQGKDIEYWNVMGRTKIMRVKSS